MKKIEFSGSELTEKAFRVYSDSSFIFYMEDGLYFATCNEGEQRFQLGTLEDVNDFLESFADGE